MLKDISYIWPSGAYLTMCGMLLTAVETGRFSESTCVLRGLDSKLFFTKLFSRSCYTAVCNNVNKERIKVSNSAFVWVFFLAKKEYPVIFSLLYFIF